MTLWKGAAQGRVLEFLHCECRGSRPLGHSLELGRRELRPGLLLDRCYCDAWHSRVLLGNLKLSRLIHLLLVRSWRDFGSTKVITMFAFFAWLISPTLRLLHYILQVQDIARCQRLVIEAKQLILVRLEVRCRCNSNIGLLWFLSIVLLVLHHASHRIDLTALLKAVHWHLDVLVLRG